MHLLIGKRIRNVSYFRPHERATDSNALAKPIRVSCESREINEKVTYGVELYLLPLAIIFSVVRLFFSELNKTIMEGMQSFVALGAELP